MLLRKEYKSAISDSFSDFYLQGCLRWLDVLCYKVEIPQVFFSQPSWFQSQDYWNLRHPCFFHTAICFVLSKYLGLFFSLGNFLVAKFCVLKFLHGFHKVNSGSRLLFPVLLDMLFIHESTLVIAA